MAIILDQHEWTREERDSLPPDGMRHEVIDGVLVMTPSPGLPHQSLVGELYLTLRAVCPPDLMVLLAPFDVALDDRSVIVPDLIVAPRAAFTERDLPTAPLLAVEVASPITRLVDRNIKLPRFERAGCPSFWILDPLEPSLTAWELQNGSYVEVAHVVADESWTATLPFPVTIAPSELRD